MRRLRPVSRALITSNLAQLPTWERSFGDITIDGASLFFRTECAEVRRRITEGDCTASTQALIRFINRTARECREGRISAIGNNGPGNWTLHRT